MLNAIYKHLRRTLHRALLCPIGLHNWQAAKKKNRTEKGVRVCKCCERKEQHMIYRNGKNFSHWKRV